MEPNKWKTSIVGIVVLCSSVCMADKVALVVNGGYGPTGNFSGFSEGVQNWYSTLLAGGYTSDNIYVIDSDGPDNIIPPWTDPMDIPSFGTPFSSEYRGHDSYFWYRGVDYGMGDIRANWVDSPKDYDGDGITDCRYDATVEGWKQITHDMSFGNPDDELLIVLISHGGVNEITNSYQFGIWDYDEQAPGDFESQGALMQGENMAAYIDRIPYTKRLIITNSCYSAAAWQHFANDNTALMANAAADEIGWIGNPLLNTLTGEFTTGKSMLGHTLPDSLEGPADLNEDGTITWAEAWGYSYDENPFGADAVEPVWIGGSYGWATEHPELYDPAGLLDDWVFSYSTPGDADGDGDVDLDDFGILKSNFGAGTTWSQGDFDGDGDVDLDDFGILKSNLSTNIIPEPSAFAMILLAVSIYRCRQSIQPH